MTAPPARLRLAFVVQRYGPEIDRGAEYECRRVAEALAPHHDVDVLTTCARDYLTWRNVYPPGVTTVNGVRVRRFPVDRPRRIRAFGRYADWLYATPHTFFDEAEWVRRQGPLTPALIEWLRAHADDHDGFLFYTYLYLPTTLGSRWWPTRPSSCRRPTTSGPSTSTSSGACSASRADSSSRSRRSGPSSSSASTRNTSRPPSSGRGSIRSRTPTRRGSDDSTGSTGPYFLYVGRVDVEKGCRALVESFLGLARAGGRARDPDPHGNGRPQLARHPAVRALGFRPEAEKHDAIAGATALVMPSPHESFSFVILEAWSQGTPVLATNRSPVLRGHVERSGAGLLYDRTPGDFRRGRQRPPRRRGAPEDPRRAGPGLRRGALPLARHHAPVPRVPRSGVRGSRSVIPRGIERRAHRGRAA